VLSPESVVAFVARLVSPGLNTITVLQVIFPHSLILSSIYVFVNTTAVCLIVGPVAIVYISVNMYETAFSMCSIFSPFTSVLCSLVPSLLAKAITETAFPLACINCTSLKSVRRTCLSLLIRVISVFSHGFSSLLLGKVLATS